ncbi:MAG: hypothetical protein KBT40_06385 [bacterium]|nr:hypothetical protein [Candidatus Minthenecus merdequi]
MKFTSPIKQLIFDELKSSLDNLPKSNRWVKLGDELLWDEIEKIYEDFNQFTESLMKFLRNLLHALLLLLDCRSILSTKRLSYENHAILA